MKFLLKLFFPLILTIYSTSSAYSFPLNSNTVEYFFCESTLNKSNSITVLANVAKPSYLIRPYAFYFQGLPLNEINTIIPLDSNLLGGKILLASKISDKSMGLFWGQIEFGIEKVTLEKIAESKISRDHLFVFDHLEEPYLIFDYNKNNIIFKNLENKVIIMNLETKQSSTLSIPDSAVSFKFQDNQTISFLNQNKMGFLRGFTYNLKTHLTRQLPEPQVFQTEQFHIKKIGSNLTWKEYYTKNYRQFISTFALNKKDQLIEVDTNDTETKAYGDFAIFDNQIYYITTNEIYNTSETRQPILQSASAHLKKYNATFNIISQLDINYSDELIDTLQRKNIGYSKMILSAHQLTSSNEVFFETQGLGGLVSLKFDGSIWNLHGTEQPLFKCLNPRSKFSTFSKEVDNEK